MASAEGLSSVGVESGDSFSRRRVFILGAGFSKAVSDLMPLTDRLGMEVGEKLKIPPELSRGTFEEWLSRLGEPQPDVLPAENLRRQAYFQQVVDFIGDELEARQRKVEEAGLPCWLFRFVSVMHLKKPTFISFNYDTLLETVASLALLKASVVLFDGKSIISVGDVIGQKPPLPPGPSRAPYPTFRLWKLHGSLSWWWVPGDITGMTVARWPLDSDELWSSIKTEKIEGFGSGSQNYRSEPEEEESDRRGRLLYGRSRYIAPPSGLKSSYYQNPFMTKLWQDSRRALENATEIYFVGYSMPPADTAARGLFRESIPSGASIFVVNPCPKLIVKQMKKWGFENIECITGEKCVEAMVDNFERERAREVVGQLKEYLNSDKVSLTDDEQSRVIWTKPPNKYGALELVGIETRSLIFGPKSNNYESPENIETETQSTERSHEGLTVSKLSRLLNENDIDEIVVGVDDCLQRVIDYKPQEREIGDDGKSIIGGIWLRVAYLPD